MWEYPTTWVNLPAFDPTKRMPAVPGKLVRCLLRIGTGVTIAKDLGHSFFFFTDFLQVLWQISKSRSTRS